MPTMDDTPAASQPAAATSTSTPRHEPHSPLSHSQPTPSPSTPAPVGDSAAPADAAGGSRRRHKRRSPTGNGGGDNPEAALRVEELDENRTGAGEQPTGGGATVAPSAAAARARTGSLSEDGSTRTTTGSPTLTAPGADGDAHARPVAGTAAHGTDGVGGMEQTHAPTEGGTALTLHELSPEDMATTTGGAPSRRSSGSPMLPRPPQPRPGSGPAAAVREEGPAARAVSSPTPAPLPVMPPLPPIRAAGGEETPAGPARRSSGLPSGNGSSYVGEGDVLLRGVTPRGEREDRGARAAAAQGEWSSPEREEDDAPPRPRRVEVPVTETPSTRTGTSTRAEAKSRALGTVTISSAGHATDGCTGRTGPDHGAGHSRQVLRTTEEYEDLDQNTESDVESDDEGFRAVKQPMASCCVDRSDPDSWRYQRPRMNGLQFPLHLNQLIAFTIYTLGSTFFYTGVVPAYVFLYQDGHKARTELICASVVPAPFFLTFLSSWIALTFIEQADLDNKGEVCAYCERRTAPSSKHCKSCNKCVTEFDHHCKWLNVCVGAKNYRVFFTYVTGGVCMIYAALAFSVAVVAKWWNELAVYSMYFRVAPILCAALMLLAIGPISQLFGFHVMLCVRGMTTYEYILFKRNKSMNRKPKDAKKKERRLFSLSKKKKEAKGETRETQSETEAGNQLAAELAKAAAALRGE